MFEPLYSAACEQIAPDEALCDRIREMLRAEADEDTPIAPLPIVTRERSLSPRRLAALAACAVVALSAAAIALALRREPLPTVQGDPSAPITTVTTAPSSENAGATPMATDTSANTTTDATASTDTGTSGGTTTTSSGETPSAATTTSDRATATKTGAPTTSTTVAPSSGSTTPTSGAPGGTPSSTERPVATASNPGTVQTPQIPSKPQGANGYDDLYQYIQPYYPTFPNRGDTLPTSATSTIKKPATSTMRSDATTGNPTFPNKSSSTKPTATTATNGTTSTAPVPDDDPPKGAPNTPTAPPFSGKVVQQEGDLCENSKRVGDLLYSLRNRTLTVSRVSGTTSTQLCSLSLGLDTSCKTEGLVVSGDRLAILYTKTTERGGADSYTTYTLLYDVRNPAAPKKLGTFGQDGYYRAARVVNGVLYLVTYHTPAGSVDASMPETYVPSLYQNGSSRVLSANNITMAKTFSHTSYTVMTALSLSGNGSRLSQQALFGQRNSHILVSDTAVLILSESRAQTAGNAVYPIVDATLFSLSGGSVTARTVTILHGDSEYIALDEYNGYFRVVAPQTVRIYSDEDEHHDSYTSLYIFDQHLGMVGKLEAFTDTLSDACFEGERILCGSVAVDTSDPTAPRLIAAEAIS